MLQAMRSTTGKVVVKIILVILIVSFVGWGVADYSQGRINTNKAAQVGDMDISIQDFSTYYRRQMNAMGLGEISQDVARQLGLASQVLQQMVNKALYDSEAQALGLYADNESVQRLLGQTPEFQNEQGHFDKERFRQIIRYTGISENSYINGIRQDIARSRLLTTLSEGITVTPEMLGAIAAYRGKQLSLALVKISTKKNRGVKQPSDAEIQAFYEKHQEDYRIPVQRQGVGVFISPQNIAKNIIISPEDLQNAYETRVETLTRPARRKIRQIIFNDEVSGNTAKRLLEAGTKFRKVADDLASSGALFNEYEMLAREDIPDTLLSDMAFSLEAGQTSALFEGDFGWMIIHVDAAEKAHITPFSQVREDIRHELALERAQAQIFELTKALDQKMGEGMSLEDAAKALSLPIEHYDFIDAEGRLADGKALSSYFTHPEVLKDIFETPIGEVSFPRSLDDQTSFLVRADRIKESFIPDLSVVRSKIMAHMLRERRYAAAQSYADALVATLREGKTIQAVAQKEKLSLTNLDRQDRDMLADAGFSEEIITALFQGSIGHVIAGKTTDGFVVTRINEVIPVQQAQNKAWRERLALELDQVMKNILVSELGMVLRDHFDVDINQSAIEQVY